MALEMIVSPFLGVVFDKLSSLITSESRLLSGVKKDLKKLSKTLSVIQTVLVDAEAKQINDQRARKWLCELKDAAYDAEDVLDECEYEGLYQESEVGDTNCTQQVSDSLSACFDFKKIAFRHKMGKKIRELIEKFDQIDAERFKFQLNPGVVVTGVDGFGLDRDTGYILTEPITYGRGEEKESIIQILLNHSSSSNVLSICPILGIGGIGKTTLAQLVYNDGRVVKQFDTRIWICVSEDFGVKRIIKMIIDHLSGKNCDLVDLSPMQNLLKTLLNGRKYLLVLDDVWDEKQESWKSIIMSLLECGVNGASIIVTTRLDTVVDSITSLPTSCVVKPSCNLKSLLEPDSWSLFEHCALGVGDEKNKDLVAIGKVVVAKCKGVPLAIKAVGNLLKSKREEFWRFVRDSEIWQLEEHGDNNILPALRLSYHHLPPHFRQCFAYCSVYPKDWIMKKESLIHQWMANGFIQSRRGIEAEDAGDEIFNGLLKRSFFQDKYEDEVTKVVTCKMHDLVHDLACSITKDECWRIKTSEMGDVLQRARHVLVSCDTNSNHSFNTLKKLSKSQPFFHTLMFDFQYHARSISQFSGVKCLRVLNLGGQWNMRSVPSWIGHLKLLKYLDLQNTGIASLPELVCGLTNLQVLSVNKNGLLVELPLSIGKLKNLRYLDLSETSIKVLPESISTLTNLQILKLEFCPMLERLPRKIKNMKSLRHLIVNWEANTELLIRSMPAGISELTRLETLGVFVLSNASEGVAGIQELGRLNQLKGSLFIEGIRHVHDPTDAQQANLKNKNKLSELLLWWGLGQDGGVYTAKEEEKKASNQVLESLQPHPNIQILKIYDYPGVELPGWVGNCGLTLPNLRGLELYDMANAVHDLHQLPPNLEVLWIERFPRLRLHPELRYPSSITLLSVGASNDPTLSSVEALPHLSRLQIGGFPEMETLSPLRSLTCLRHLQIASSSSVTRLLPQLENLAETLAKLSIIWCYDLDCITEEGLRNLASLETLKFISCSGLTSIANTPSSFRHLTSLTSLDLIDCPKLELSAVGFQHLVALKELFLEELPQMTSLPDGIQHVTTLQGLYIRKCENLRTLPEWLLQQHLPQSLCYLRIRECHHELHKRCEVDKGEDWHKISHLQIDNRE